MDLKKKESVVISKAAPKKRRPVPPLKITPQNKDLVSFYQNLCRRDARSPTASATER